MTVKIECKIRSLNQFKKFENMDVIKIKKDDDVIFEVRDCESEGACLSEVFFDCHSVIKLLEDAYNAGKNGEDWVFSSSESDDI